MSYIIGVCPSPSIPGWEHRWKQVLFTSTTDVGASQMGLVVKNLPVNAGEIRDVGSIPGLGRSPGGGHGNPLQYSCLENPMDRRIWQGTVHRVQKSQTQLKQLSTHRLVHIPYTYLLSSVQFSWVQSLSCVWLFATPWITARQASLSITNSWSSLRLTSIESVMPSSHLILRCPLFLLPPIPPSIKVFSNESTLCMKWPKSYTISIVVSREGMINQSEAAHFM